MMSKRAGVGRAFNYVALTFAAIAGYGFAMGVYSFTLVSPWVPVGVGVCGGLLTAISISRLCRSSGGRSARILNFIISAVIGGGVLSALFLGLNWAGAKPVDSCSEATVTCKYTRERQRTKRVGRRYVATGDKYMVFCVDIAIPDHEAKPLEVPYHTYSRLHKGSKVRAKIEHGLFGLTLVRYDQSQL